MTSRLAPLLLLLLPLAATAASGPRQPLDRVVAVVNDDVITRIELDERMRGVRRQLAEQKLRAPADDVLARQVLDRLVLERLQLQLAARSGVRVDDEMLNTTMRNLARQNDLSLTDFRAAIEREGHDYEKFRDDVRREMIIGRVQQAQVHNRITVTDQEIENLLSQQGEEEAGQELRLGHILIALPEAASAQAIQAAQDRAERVLAELRGGADFGQTAVARSDGQQALTGGDLGWRARSQIPSLFLDALATLKPGEVSGLIRSPSGFHIIKLLERRGQAQRIVTQTHARHILIRVNEITPDGEARRRLEVIRDRIEQGEDFAQLARAQSDDKGSASRGGDLGWANPGQFVPQFEEAMRDLPPGKISAPFRTAFGWHIVEVLGRRDHDSTEDFRRARAADQIRRRKGDEELALWLRRLRDEAYVELRPDP